MDKNMKALRAIYPRVSEILSPYAKTFFENVSLEVMANACERGTKVHTICKALVDGYFVPEIDEECRPYIDSFLLWKAENKFTVLETEKRYYDDDLKYSGQVDIVVKQDGKTILYDVKTSATVSASWPVQLAAYAKLIELTGIKIDEVAVIQLKKTGKKPVVHVYEDREEYSLLFSALLLNYNYFLRKKTESLFLKCKPL